MRILRDTVRPELARIKRELEALRSMTIHVGIMGDSDSDILMIARVHEYGADISAKKAKNLAIPLTKEAKDAGSPRAFNDLEMIPGHDPNVRFLVRKRKRKARSKGHREVTSAIRESIHDDYDPKDYDWLFMLVQSVHIPERSFIRASYDGERDNLVKRCKEAVDGIVYQKWTAQEAADYIGAWASEKTKTYLDHLSPPKHKITQLTSNSYVPLVDTIGRIRASITYKVEGGGSS